MSKITNYYPEPDFASMSIDEWTKYEFNRDYATVISDVTSYDHGFLREFLEAHWQLAFQCGGGGMLPVPRTLSDEECRIVLAKHHAMREQAITAAGDVESKRIYIWPKGQMPKVTDYSENPGYQHPDMPDFEPYMLEQLAPEGTEIKGAVILSAGGGHHYRSNIEEAYEVALALNKLGYQTFILNYRIKPYTDDESALDVARAVKIVRANAAKYGINPNRIATAGFSYGGIVTSLAGEKYAGTTNASALVPGYTPDEIDAVSADMNAYLAIYSVTTDEINNEKFPPTFFCWGLEDPMLCSWAGRCYQLMLEKGIKTECHTMAGVPHGFGAGIAGNGHLYTNAALWPQLADVFLQDVYENGPVATKQREIPRGV